MSAILFLVFALPPQAPSPLPPQAPHMAPCGMGHMCPCGCYGGGPCTCRAIPQKTYAEWREAVAKKRRVARTGGGVSCLCDPCGCTQRAVCPCDSPLLVSTPRPVTVLPALFAPRTLAPTARPLFAPSFASAAACRGGG